MYLIDFENPQQNDLVVCNQFTVKERHSELEVRDGTGLTKRLDVVLFVNGLPLVVMELKNPTAEKATVHEAFKQLQSYKEYIPSLFCYNGVLVASDGHDARVGSLTAGWNRFMAWKTADGKKEDTTTTPQIKTLIQGMLSPIVLLDLIRHFTVFEESTKEDPKTALVQIETVKKIAAYHQYYAVKRAVQSTIRAAAANPTLGFRSPPSSYGLPSVENQPNGDHKAGVVWHTQGSGKSLSMLFYAGLLVVHPEMKIPRLL